MNDHLPKPLQAAPDASAADSGDGSQTGHIVDALEATIVGIERLIDNRTRDELQQAAQDGGWGIVEILSHILDWEEVIHERVWSVLEEDHPELEDYDDTLWAIEHEYGSQDGRTVFTHISDLRQQLVERLRNLEVSMWHRQATLRGHGEISLIWLMENLVKHDAKHLAQARDVFG